MDTKYSTMFLIGFVIYASILVFVGWWVSRGKSDGKNYLTGGGHLSFFLIFATMGATVIGTGSSMGATANGFKNGWGGSIYGIGAASGIFLMAYISKKTKLREKNFITMAEEAQYYFGGKRIIRSVMSVMMFIIEIVWLGNHMNGGATYLAYVTGLSPLTAKIIALFAFALYVFIGGYLAVVWTDAIQLIILLVGFVAITLTAIPAAGGWGAITQTLEAAGKGGNLSFYGIETMGLMGAFSLAFSIAIPAFGTPTYKMRVYTAKDDKTATRALNMSAWMIFLFSLCPSVIGMAAFAIAKQTGAEYVLATPDFAFAFMATNILGPVMGLLFMIAGLSATMSSGDSDAIAGVTILIQDLYPTFTGRQVPEEKIKNWSRIALCLTLGFAFIATLFAKDIISYISNIGGSFIPGVSVAMILGSCWKRANWQGGLASVLGGTVFGVLYLVVPFIKDWVTATFTGPAIPATLTALILCVAVSLMTPEDKTSEADCMRRVIEDRGRLGN